MKKGGMRDSPQKGAGMRDQDPPSRPCTMCGMLASDRNNFMRFEDIHIQQLYVIYNIRQYK